MSVSKTTTAMSTPGQAVASTGSRLLVSSSHTSRSAFQSAPALCLVCQQKRHATFIERPRRPYTFTQLMTLSDGSTYLHRTTSPLAVYMSNRDTRNSPMWNPSSQRLMNVVSTAPMMES